MTGNESDPAKDPDETVFDPDDVFGGSAADGDSTAETSRDPDSIWGPFTGDATPEHSTQVLESDAFGRPFLGEDGKDPFAPADPGGSDVDLWAPAGDGPSAGEAPSPGDGQDGGLWSPPGFGDAPAETSAHMEHEVPPPWEFEPGGPPAPWSQPPAENQQWQPAQENGQPGWQPPAPQPGFDAFGGPQQDSPWAPGAPDSPFGQQGAFAPDGGNQQGGLPSFDVPQPGAEVPNPFAAADFGPPDSAPSPFDAGPFGDQDQPPSPFGEPQQPAEPQPDSFWPSEAGQQAQPDLPQPADASAAQDTEQASPFWAPQSEDEHSTDSIPRPSGGEQPQFDGGGQPQGEAPPSTWGPWPGDAGQQAPPPVPPPQPAAPRYDLSQFQQGYQPPPQQQQQPPPPQQQPPQQSGYPGFQQQPPQQGGYPGFQQAPPQQMPPQQFPGMAPPLQMPPQQQQPLPLTSDSLSPQALLRPRKAPPTSGWRRAVFKVSGGLIDPGESSKEVQRQQMVSLVRTPVAGGHYRVAVLSLKGGVGKTTTTVGLGSTLASLRGDRIIAVDANPDRGTLSEKVRLETRANVRDLLADKDNIQRYSDVRQYTSQAASRLEVLASDPDPAISEAFSEDDYRSIADVLEHYYSICLTDCGTGLLHSAMRGVLGLADQIVLVSSASVDGARSASATLDWLDAHDYGDLVQSGVVVMSAVRPQNKAVDLSRLEQHFSARCRALVRIPFDPHLEAGAEFVLEQLSAPARDAYLELTAAVAAGFQYRLPR